MLIGGEPATPAVKLVMLGNSGVGKSSLINAWITGSALQNPHPTIGAVNHMQRLTLDEQEVDLFLWDTAGQEQFASLSPLYVRSTSVAIIVADITDQNSFEKVEMWQEIVTNINSKETPLILAINKVDLGEEVLSKEEIKERFQKTFSAIFYVSAAKVINVEELFTEAAKLGFAYHQKENQKSNKFMITIQEEKKKEKKCCK